MKKTISVNFFAGPGSGKSTLSAALFSELKSRDINCELVVEYAKKKVWEEAFKVFECQLYVSAKQIYSMFIVSKHVDIIITDSPILLSSVYSNNDLDLNNILLREHNKYDNINIFLKRIKKYNPKGRMQTEKEAKEKDKQIIDILLNNNIDFKTFDGDKKSVEPITDLIIKHLNNGR
jgi:adenylate kinase family enzyme